MSRPPDAYEVIAEDILPDVLERFIRKGQDYGDAWKLLGARGQFSDINRKFWKLYNSIWLEQELVGEQPDECVEDIIGHCLLLLYILKVETTPEGAGFSSPTTDVGAHGARSGTVGYPEAGEVLEAIERAAKNECGDGSSLTRISDAVLALYQRKAVEAK